MNEKRMLWIQVADGRIVFNPATGRNLEPVATQVCDSPYWRNRVRCGDVQPVPAPAPPASCAPAAAEEEALQTSRKTKK